MKRQTRRAPTDGELSADTVGLRYASDSAPGIRRIRAGKGFRYLHPSGRAVREPGMLARIAGLAIPPAYEDVWISPDPRGHLQATGRDARGRKQYRYHPRWHAVRSETKFERMLAFSKVLPAIRKRVRRDLAREGLPKEKVTAAVVRLLDSTHIRIGNKEYARANKSYGLTTLRDRNAEIGVSSISLEFRGKGGKLHRCNLSDRRLARILARCRALPGEELFQYMDATGARQTIDSADVNAYLRDASQGDFTAKDFRTWSGTLLAVSRLRSWRSGGSARELKRHMLAALDEVAADLDNTRAVTRRYYVHPEVLEAFERGELARAFRAGRRGGCRAQERALVSFLTRRMNTKAVRSQRGRTPVRKGRWKASKRVPRSSAPTDRRR